MIFKTFFKTFLAVLYVFNRSLIRTRVKVVSRVLIYLQLHILSSRWRQCTDELCDDFKNHLLDSVFSYIHLTNLLKNAPCLVVKRSSHRRINFILNENVSTSVSFTTFRQRSRKMNGSRRQNRFVMMVMKSKDVCLTATDLRSLQPGDVFWFCGFYFILSKNNAVLNRHPTRHLCFLSP